MATVPKKRSPGVAVEMFVYRYLPSGGRGGSRTLVFNCVLTDPQKLLARFEHGRYRVEWRDSRRQIVKVETFKVGRIGVYRPGRIRPPRRVPPPKTKLPELPPVRPVIDPTPGSVEATDRYLKKPRAPAKRRPPGPLA